MKKVIVCVTSDLENDQRVNRSALTLYQNGFDVTVVGRLLPRSKKFVRVYKTYRMKLLFSKGFLFYAEYNVRLLLYLLFRKSTILLSNDLDTLPACWTASTIKRNHLVFDSHELFSELPEIIDKKFIKTIWTKFEDFLIPRIGRGITVCNPIAEFYRTKYKTKFEVVRNVPIPIEPIATSKEVSNKILYQGALNKGRGLELLFAAMHYLPDMQLIIAGKGDLDVILRNMSKNMGLTNVVFLGQVPYDHLWKITMSAAVGVSLEEDLGLNYRYAMPNKIFDYIQSGVPQVVSDLPVMSELVRTYGTGEILTERTPEALAVLLKDVVEKHKKGYYTYNLKHAAKLLNWDNEKLKFLAIFGALT